MAHAAEESELHTRLRQRIDQRPFIDLSTRVPAHEHPTVWAYVGEGRYLQAAFCRSTAALYAEQFDKTTSKSLSNIAAKCVHFGLLEWCKDVGCTWDESLYVSAAAGGSTAVLDFLFENSCPMPSDPKPVCEAAAEGDFVVVVQWLSDKGLWYEDACITGARAGKMEVIKWQLMRNKASTRFFGDNMLLNDLCRAACDSGQVEVLQLLNDRNCSWDSERCVRIAIEHGHLNILAWFHARNMLPLGEGTAMCANRSERFDVLEYLHGLGCPLLSEYALRCIRRSLKFNSLFGMDPKKCFQAALAGDLERLQSLRARGYPWHVDTLKVARLFSNESPKHRIIEQWAMENGCPEPDM